MSEQGQTGQIDAAVAAYNSVWDAAKDITAANVVAVRRASIAAALTASLSREAALAEALEEIAKVDRDAWEFENGNVVPKYRLLARAALRSKPPTAE